MRSDEQLQRNRPDLSSNWCYNSQPHKAECSIRLNGITPRHAVEPDNILFEGNNSLTRFQNSSRENPSTSPKSWEQPRQTDQSLLSCVKSVHSPSGCMIGKWSNAIIHYFVYCLCSPVYSGDVQHIKQRDNNTIVADKTDGWRLMADGSGLGAAGDGCSLRCWIY